MMMINQNEMIKLACGLRDRGIDFATRSVYNGLQIRCDGWDAVCHNLSVGHTQGLIEIMGLPQCHGDTLGCLPAADVLAMLDENSADDKPEYIDDDSGFDPYEGCYTYDC